MRTACVGAALLLLWTSTGCVTRRYTITSSPMGAMVYRNGRPLGITPVDDHYVYYGTYKFTLVKDGYQTLVVEQDIGTPWYETPGIDFITENLVPWEVEDKRVFHYNLQPLAAVAPGKVLDRSTELRQRGKTIGPPGGAPRPLQPVPATPPPPPPAPPTIPTLPAPTPLPAPGTLPATPPPAGDAPILGATAGGPPARP